MFSTKLNPEPADLPPMELKVDEDKWRVSSNQGPARHQTGQKQEAVLTQIEQMLLLQIIITSQAEYYSQVHMTPKPNNAWRFCIDYQGTNQASKGIGWPLPNIPDMLDRLGRKKSKYYAKIDLTSGYHQAPLAK